MSHDKGHFYQKHHFFYFVYRSLTTSATIYESLRSTENEIMHHAFNTCFLFCYQLFRAQDLIHTPEDLEVHKDLPIQCLDIVMKVKY